MLIPIDGPPREIELPNGGARFMRTVRALIGTDCAERFWITDRWEAWLDEDGMAARKPVALSPDQVNAIFRMTGTAL